MPKKGIYMGKSEGKSEGKGTSGTHIMPGGKRMPDKMMKKTKPMKKHEGCK